MTRQNKPDIRIYICETKEEANQKAFELLKEEIKKKPDITLGGATGSSPTGLYERLMNSELDLSQAKMIFLDEYFGRINYHNYTRNYLQSAKNTKAFQEKSIFVPRGCFYDENDRLISSNELEKILKDNRDDWEERGLEIHIKESAKNQILRAIREFCKRYEKRIDDVGIDYQILGIGVEGHIGFNEQGTSPESLTNLTRLAPSTIEENGKKGDFPDGVPAHFALTQGIATIAKAKNRIMLAYGEQKQKAVYDMLLGEISPDNPAGYLKEMSGTTYILLDKESAARLDLEELEARGYTIKD